MNTTPQSAPTTAGYRQLTQGSALTILSERLGDLTLTYWSSFELRLYLAEALRTWQAYTGWYRDRAVLNASSNNTWYDLSSSLTPPILSYNVADQDVASVLLYHLLERQLFSGAWSGTDQFNLPQIQAALQNRLNRFLGDTGMVLTYALQQSGISAPVTRATLPSTTIDIRRVAWVSASGVTTVLWRESEWGLNSFLSIPALPTDPPAVYSLSSSSPTTIHLAPPPANSGLIELISVQSGPTLGLVAPVGSPVLLGVPDDFVWGIKFGVLADLLSSDGQAKDAFRAQYCESRYQECIQIAQTFPSIIGLQSNDLPVWPGSVFDLDAFSPGWQNQQAGPPLNVGLAGRNLLALSPMPSAAMSLTVDVVRNMPVPASDADFLQVPADVLPSLLDYVLHLASFKMGGDEFINTQAQRANFLVAASEYNARLRQLNFFNDATRSIGQTQSSEIPRLSTPSLVSYQVSAAAPAATASR